MHSPPRHLVVATVLVVISLGLVASEVVQKAWQQLTSVLSPWERSLAAIGPQRAGPTELLDLRGEIGRLENENSELRQRLAAFQEIRDVGPLPSTQEVALANIVLRSNRQGRRHCEIDLGEIDRVVIGTPALVGWNLVGVVVKVQENRSLVRQLTDSESRIAAELYDGEALIGEGSLAGTGKRGELLLNFIEDRQGLEIHRGMRVVAAGLDPRIPRGLFLGTVTAASRSPAVDHWHIEVSPFTIAESCTSLAVLRPAPVSTP